MSGNFLNWLRQPMKHNLGSLGEFGQNTGRMRIGREFLWDLQPLLMSCVCRQQYALCLLLSGQAHDYTGCFRTELSFYMYTVQRVRKEVGYSEKEKSVYVLPNELQAFGDSAQSFGACYDRSIHNTPPIFVIVAGTDLSVWSFFYLCVFLALTQSEISQPFVVRLERAHLVRHAVLVLCV